MGIIRAGFVAFPVSTRNSAVGVANLLYETKCEFLFVSEDASMQTLASDALNYLKASDSLKNHAPVHQLVVPSIAELLPQQDDNFAPLPPFKPASMNTPALILHSSGRHHTWWDE